MRRSTGILALLVGLGPAGCNKQQSKTEAPAAQQTAAAEHGALRLGHYSSGDGLVGLVLDRTGEQVRVRVDGSEDVIELTPVPTGRGSELALKDPTGKRVLLIDAGGSVSFVAGGGEVVAVRDANAAPLPAATIAGRAPAEKPTERAQALKALTAISVVDKLPGYKPEHAGDLSRVERAFGAADASMVVHVVRDVDRAEFAPAPRTIGNKTYAGGGHRPSPEQWSKQSEGLRAHGGVVVGAHDFERGGRIRIHRPKGYPPPLRANTTGVVWHVDGGWVFFVSVDGGRYRLEWGDLEIGGPSGKQPPPLQHTLLTFTDVEYLGKAGSLEKPTLKRFVAINDKYDACVRKTYKGLAKDLDKLKTAKLDWGTRNFRAEKAVEKWGKAVDKRCKPHVKAMEDALVELIDQRTTARRKLAGKAKFARDRV